MFGRFLKMVALCAAVTVLAAASNASAVAQTYPVHPIKIVIGFGQGGKYHEYACPKCGTPQTVTTALYYR